MKKERFEQNCVPPGFPFSSELTYFTVGILCATLYSLRFVLDYWNARHALFRQNPLTGEWVLEEGARIAPFSEILGSALTGFLILACGLLVFVVLHYQSHFHGSRSIYLMRRLPDRWELHRRCLVGPVLGILCCVVTAGILLLLYFAVYRFATPQECLTPLGGELYGRT